MELREAPDEGDGEALVKAEAGEKGEGIGGEKELTEAGVEGKKKEVIKAVIRENLKESKKTKKANPRKLSRKHKKSQSRQKQVKKQRKIKRKRPKSQKNKPKLGKKFTVNQICRVPVGVFNKVDHFEVV